MTDQNSTNSNSSKSAELKAKFDALKERATAVALSIQAAIPVTERSLAAQEAFLLTMSDLKELEKLFGTVEETFNGVGATFAAEAGDDSEFASLAQALSDMLMEQFGVSKEAILPAILKDLTRQLELVEILVIRAETSLKDMEA